MDTPSSQLDACSLLAQSMFPWCCLTIRTMSLPFASYSTPKLLRWFRRSCTLSWLSLTWPRLKYCVKIAWDKYIAADRSQCALSWLYLTRWLLAQTTWGLLLWWRMPSLSFLKTESTSKNDAVIMMICLMILPPLQGQGCRWQDGSCSHDQSWHLTTKNLILCVCRALQGDMQQKKRFVRLLSYDSIDCVTTEDRLWSCKRSYGLIQKLRRNYLIGP